jgi:hypothetical protein
MSGADAFRGADSLTRPRATPSFGSGPISWRYIETHRV